MAVAGSEGQVNKMARFGPRRPPGLRSAVDDKGLSMTMCFFYTASIRCSYSDTGLVEVNVLLNLLGVYVGMNEKCSWLPRCSLIS